MTDISKDVKELRKIMPQAVITAKMEEKYLDYECDLRHAKISPEEHDALFAPIKKLFGERLMERYSHCTGHFEIYVRHQSDQTKLN